MSSYIFGFTSGNLEGCFQGKTSSQPLKVFMLQTNFSINLCTAVSWKNIYPPHIPPTYEFPVEGQSLLKWSPPVLCDIHGMTLTSIVYMLIESETRAEGFPMCRSVKWALVLIIIFTISSYRYIISWIAMGTMNYIMFTTLMFQK